jgi:DNA-binding HxlR family transcriptional regulator
MKNVAPLPGRPVRGSRSGRSIMALLDLLGRRGTLKILWVLRKDVLTFRDLGAAAELNPSTLNARLRELRAAGLVRHEAGYGLTPAGGELMAALKPLRAWAKGWTPPAAG